MKFLALLVAIFVLGGCGTKTTPKVLPDSKTLSPAANEALKALVSARGVLFAGYDYIDTGVRTKAIEPKQGREWFNELDKGRDALAKAQQVWDEGGFDEAKLQAQAQETAMKLIRDAAIKALERAAKPQEKSWIQSPQDFYSALLSIPHYSLWHGGAPRKLSACGIHS